MTDRPSLDSVQWDRIAELFEQALDLSGVEREAFVAAQLADDPVAKSELQALIAEHDRGNALGIERWLLREDDGHDEPMAAGTRVGAYRVDALIGRGGMGEVYRGVRVDGTFEQDVAIKVLRAGLSSADLVRRFATERRILARLTHPSIVGILDGGSTADGRPYLVMPFVDGQQLVKYCDEHKLSLDERLFKFMRVAAAVQYAHVQLVVHRDIKPSNILVTDRGDVRLLDFGIAKLLSRPDDITGSETQSAVRLLTPEHASPEQVRGETVSTASDVYSLGVLLYELISGTRPHRLRGRSMIELERDILDLQPIAPSVAAQNSALDGKRGADQGEKQSADRNSSVLSIPWAKRLRGDLDRIVLKALRKEPERRYSSVGQFTDDIERFLKGLPVSAERDRFSYRFRKFVTRNRVGVILGSLAATLLVAFTISTFWQSQQIARERDRVTREKDATESVVALLTSLFARANPVAVPGGDTLRVAQLLAAGDTLVDSLVGNPHVQARMWRVLGTMHLARGRVDVAEQTLRRAYDRMMEIDGSDSLDVAQTYHELTRAVDSHEGGLKSLPMFEQSVRRLRDARGSRPLDVKIAERELAVRTAGQASARQALERLAAPTPLANATDSMERAASLNALGTERYNSGRYRDARDLFGETLDLLTRLLPTGHPHRSLVTGNLAMAHRDLGEFEVAEGLSRAMLADARGEVTPNPISLASAMERLASVQALRGFLEDAENGYQGALAIELQQLPPTHAMTVWNRYSRSVIMSSRGRSRDALALLDSVLVIMRGNGFSAADTLQLLDLQSSYLMSIGRVKEASRQLRATDAPLKLAVPAAHPALDTHMTLEGMAALAESRYADALNHFTKASEAKRLRDVPSHPEISGDECGRGIAIARLGRRDEAAPLLKVACARYRTFGTHFRLLVRWAAEAE